MPEHRRDHDEPAEHDQGRKRQDRVAQAQCHMSEASSGERNAWSVELPSWASTARSKLEHALRKYSWACSITYLGTVSDS